MNEMADNMVEVAEPVASWLQPLDGEPCGSDLEYDPTYLELQQAALGKPETQFAAAEPPVWLEVREGAAALFERTRDLRIALLWARAELHVAGLPGLLPVLQLFLGLLQQFWDQGLHPQLDPDDGDSFARLSVLANLDKIDGLLGDARQALVLPDRRLGGLRVRDIEVALDRLPARPEDKPRSIGELHGLFGDLSEACEQVRSCVDNSLLVLKQLQREANDRFGGAEEVDTKAMRQLLEAVRAALPSAAEADEVDEADEDSVDETPNDDADAPAPATSPAPRRGAGLSQIESREDAIRGIRLICEYLERSEPTNPAQLLLRRAERLIQADFMQLIRELAPDAAAEVARVMGVKLDDDASDD